MSDTLTVHIEQGTLRGTGDEKVAVYKGIPFGRPPTGPHRFGAPEPAQGWTGVRDATGFAPKAVQGRNPLGGGLRHPMSEDCLALNVWTPRAPGPHPVLVWVHGGAQVVDGTANRAYDGSALAARGVVVVSVAYRLGPLGFLRLRHLLGDDFAGSENNALRDVVLALRWVRDSITAFGGDPARVTLAGESAGAKNTVNALAIPETRTLVRGAISASGGCLTVHAPDQAEEVTAALLEVLAIPPADAERLLTLEAGELIAAAGRMKGVNFPWRAVVDGTVLPTDTATAARRGDLADVALLVASNADEADTFNVTSKLDRRDPTTAATTHIRSEKTLRSMLDAYASLYGDRLSDRDRRLRLLTAEEYWIPSVRLAEAQQAGGGAAWMYRFDWAPSWHPAGLRAAHGADVPFVFGTLNSGMGRALTVRTGRAGKSLAERLQQAWVAFVSDGAPTAAAPAWDRYDEARAVMLVHRRWTPVQDPDGPERRLWDGVL